MASGQVNVPFWVKFFNLNLQMPVSAMAYIWVGISSAYVGIDRVAYAVKSSTLEYGKTDVGSPQTLRKVILISGLLLLQGIIFNSVVDYDFDLPELASAFGTTVLLYIAGQKAVKITKYAGSGPDATPEQLQEAQNEKNVDEGKSDVPFATSVKAKTEDEIVADRISDALATPESKEAKKVVIDVLKEDVQKIKEAKDGE
jgi:hypothetical protein